jgi:2-polyprenyl-3-methyl-5-hydroxy-6-metoxy-1,4-benzoquinol methylase
MRRRAGHAPELLDMPHHERAELEQSLEQVAEVNRLLGGTRAVLLTLDELGIGRHASDSSQRATILDIGTGSADIPVAIDAWARRKHLDIDITASDRHPQMREIAAERTRRLDRITIADGDALELHHEDESFDIVLLSLTLHHFERADQVRALREAARVARTAVIVNELERCLPNYLGARFLALTRWRSNRLTRHDGPLSVLQAFTADELRAVAADAGLRIITLRRRFFFRLVLVGVQADRR